MLISSVEAKNKFRILEAQLIQILESGQVTVYDEAYSHQVCCFKKQFDKISEENIFNSTLHKMARLKSLECLALHFYYNEKEFKAALVSLYPEHFSMAQDSSNSISATSAPTFIDSPLPLPPIKKSVSREGQNKEQVQNTIRENQEAFAYVRSRLTQNAFSHDIAAELKSAGGGAGVIGCLLKDDSVNVTAAREHGKYLLKK